MTPAAMIAPCSSAFGRPGWNGDVVHFCIRSFESHRGYVQKAYWRTLKLLLSRVIGTVMGTLRSTAE